MVKSRRREMKVAKQESRLDGEAVRAVKREREVAVMLARCFFLSRPSVRWLGLSYASVCILEPASGTCMCS